MQRTYMCLKSCIRYGTYNCYLLILQEMHQGTQNYENVPELYMQQLAETESIHSTKQQSMIMVLSTA